MERPEPSTPGAFDASDPAAARMALWLADDHLSFMSAGSVANGWIERAESLLAYAPDAPERAWLPVYRGHHALQVDHDAERALALADEALECAERLPLLMPGAGHIVHMPGHIYIRTGRYVDAVRTNQHAVHSDESVLSDQGGMGIYAGAYYPHNYHFMAFAATMAGMSETALAAARAVAPKVPVEIAREVYWIQNAVVLPQLTLLTFGRWEEVLDEPLPPEELEQASILARYTRGVAHAALGDFGRAREILEEIRERARTVEGDPSMNPIPHIAPLALAGEIALRSGWHGQAVQHFRAAAEIEDALLYEEPPLWYYPIRHSLGRALLEAGRPEAAEEAYRTERSASPRTGGRSPGSPGAWRSRAGRQKRPRSGFAFGPPGRTPT